MAVDKEFTSEEAADGLGLDRDDARFLLNAFVALGIAEKTGLRKTEGQRGKGAVTYTLAADAATKLRAKVEAFQRYLRTLP